MSFPVQNGLSDLAILTIRNRRFDAPRRAPSKPGDPTLDHARQQHPTGDEEAKAARDVDVGHSRLFRARRALCSVRIQLNPQRRTVPSNIARNTPLPNNAPRNTELTSTLDVMATTTPTTAAEPAANHHLPAANPRRTQIAPIAAMRAIFQRY